MALRIHDVLVGVDGLGVGELEGYTIEQDGAAVLRVRLVDEGADRLLEAMPPRVKRRPPIRATEPRDASCRCPANGPGCRWCQ